MTNLLSLASTLDDTRINKALRRLTYADNLLRVMSTTEPIRCADLTQLVDDDHTCQYTSAVLRKLIQAGLVRRVQNGTETIMAGGRWANHYDFDDPRYFDEGAFYLTGQKPKEVLVYGFVKNA